jgi:hypothetical protein
VPGPMLGQQRHRRGRTPVRAPFEPHTEMVA